MRFIESHIVAAKVFLRLILIPCKTTTHESYTPNTDHSRQDYKQPWFPVCRQTRTWKDRKQK